MSFMNELHTVGLDPFGVQLVAESLLKSPVAELSAREPLKFFFPVTRGDCPGWSGVTITLEAVRTATGACAQGLSYSAAMQLSLKLRISLSYDIFDGDIYLMATPPGTHQGYDERVGDDPREAARLAITRAWVSMGSPT